MKRKCGSVFGDGSVYATRGEASITRFNYVGGINHRERSSRRRSLRRKSEEVRLFMIYSAFGNDSIPSYNIGCWEECVTSHCCSNLIWGITSWEVTLTNFNANCPSDGQWALIFPGNMGRSSTLDTFLVEEHIGSQGTFGSCGYRWPSVLGGRKIMSQTCVYSIRHASPPLATTCGQTAKNHTILTPSAEAFCSPPDFRGWRRTLGRVDWDFLWMGRLCLRLLRSSPMKGDVPSQKQWRSLNFFCRHGEPETREYSRGVGERVIIIKGRGGVPNTSTEWLSNATYITFSNSLRWWPYIPLYSAHRRSSHNYIKWTSRATQKLMKWLLAVT